MILDNEALIRLLSFFCVLLIMLGVELWYPRRQLKQSRMLRWSTNFGITLVNTVLMRLLLPAAAVAVALHQEAAGAGLFWMLGIPEFISVIISLVLLDLIIFGQHVVFHRIPWLWRIHRTHHTDIEIDVTTGTRFHPIEIFLSMLIKLLAVWLLGIPAIAVIIFEVLLNAMALFNHSNIDIPTDIDEKLRQAIVTPDMHRVHHSIEASETDSNFGFCLSCWDRWFKTYTAQPAAGHANMTIGLSDFRDQRDIRLDKLLLQPFVSLQDDQEPEEPEPVRRSFTLNSNRPADPPVKD